MDILQFKDQLFEKGKTLGFSDMEIYYQSNTKFSTKVYKGDIDSYDLAKEGGVAFRGMYNGQMGYAYTEKVDEDSINLLLNESKDHASIKDNDDKEVIFEGSNHYESLELFSEELADVSNEAKVSLLKQVEEECFALSDKVSSVNYCLLESNDVEKMIANTKGLEKREKGNVVYIFLSVVAKEGEDIKSAAKLNLTRDFSTLDPKKIAKEVTEEALSFLGADTVDSKDYPVILRNTAAASLLNVFSSSFSAENVQKGKSRLTKKLGETIANSNVTIVDDPHLKEGFATRTFDSEGVATKKLNVVDEGVLKTFFHNLKTAHKDNVASTGHANKSSYKGTITVSPSNLFIEPGEVTYNDLVGAEKEAMVITDLQGLHSGANPISGDFSLAANGYLVKDGKIDRPVNQITVAGNFFEMLEQVEGIGEDLDFGMPSGGYVGSPSLKVGMLSIAGK
ncbi:TldD/PmbA family protein [Bacillus shivajii]|uniref:TldD/PmbA family protein n=1 Tax=Bacillus shivajii TaxID=1983719 RepID=UPI001CF9B3E5|nr:TldD/PmbA family protein [Bacillus shivajii]UCZ54042.1 TldD/PmbA family protein [Bacillus shivajii]